MKILSKVLRKSIKLNNTRRAFKINGRDFILAVRKKKSRGYCVVRHKGLQGAHREFDQYHFGYVTLYKSVDKDTLQSDF